MITAVFDCMVFLQAATNDLGPAFACLALVETGDVALAASPSILAEVRDVLTRPKIHAKFPHLTQDRVDIFLRKVAAISAVVSDVPDAGVRLRDPDDLPYLNLAVAADSAYIVTRDGDLLDLMDEPSFVEPKGCPMGHMGVGGVPPVRPGKFAPTRWEDSPANRTTT